MRPRLICGARRLAWSAAWMLILCGCSTVASTPSTPIPVPPPAACRMPCPPLPRLTDGQPATLRRWVSDVMELYGDCRRVHTACAEGL